MSWISRGYDLSGALAYVSGNSGATVSASNGTLTISLGQQIAASTAASVVISGIKSPQLLGSTGAYALRSKDSAGALIDEGTASANTLTAPAITLLTPQIPGSSSMPDSPMRLPGAMTAGSPITSNFLIPLTAAPAISILSPKARPMTEPTPEPSL